MAREGIFRLPFLALLPLLTVGCAIFEVAAQQERDAAYVRLYGRIVAPDLEGGVFVVVLVRWPEGRDAELVDHFVMTRPGRFYFAAPSGTYSTPAFHDRNENLRFDPDEPAVPSRPETTFTLAAGERARDIEIRILPEDRVETAGVVDILDLQARSPGSQLDATAGQLLSVGTVVDLAEPRFGPESGPRGLWRPFDFVFEFGTGVFFLEPYDPERIPVLFVHGASGYPQEFTALIEALDRDRFQPWFFFYPSGAQLQSAAEYLSRALLTLEVQHGFDTVFLVAHSMGGLVSRAFLLHHEEATGQPLVPLFVSLSTPWMGHAAAQKGVDFAPAPVYSWVDMAPGSDFLRSIFFADEEATIRRALPEHVEHHLVFGFQRDAKILGRSDDKVVTVASELRPEAQDDAASVRGFDLDHAGILRSPDAVRYVNDLLDAASEPAGPFWLGDR